MSTIRIQKISITDLTTDAIVNAANEGLWAGGGVCGAIFRAAGHDELQAACNEIGHCDTGSAVITPGFRLKAKYIIHAVGPRWKDGKHGEPEQLYGAYFKSLQLAAENGCKSIGFPLISAGIFGYPAEKAWEQAFEACGDFLSQDPEIKMEIIFAVLNDEGVQTGNDILLRSSASRYKIAEKIDWKTSEMPAKRDTFILNRSFTQEQMAALQKGNIPQQMEDKWFWYMTGNTLYAHRSWTGFCIYIIDFKDDNNHLVTVNRDPEQYSGTDIEDDREKINDLLNWWTNAPYDYYNEWLFETVKTLEAQGAIPEDNTPKNHNDLREERIKIFEDTLDWIGDDPDLADSVKLSKQKTEVFYEDDYPAFDRPAVDEEIVVTGYRSYEAAMRLSKEYPDSKIAVMNFANAYHAGGGVTRGAGAQEESLCRTSTLYPLIYRRMLRDTFYKHHDKLREKSHTSKASDSLIYTESVIICKTDDPLPERMTKEDWVSVDVITIAAPDLRQKSNKYAPVVGNGTVMNDAELFGYHVKRAIHMLTVAAAKDVDILVLGAFGCGAFQNDPEVVARAFKTALQEFPKVFKRVEFAVYCPPEGSKNYEVFKRVLTEEETPEPCLKKADQSGIKLAVVYDSKTGNTKQAAEWIAEGMNQVEGVESRIFRIDEVDLDYLKDAAGMVAGCPAYTAMLTPDMRTWLLQVGEKIDLSGKLGGAYATEQYTHGGGELVIQSILTSEMVSGMLVFSGGRALGKPVIHLGPVGVNNNVEEHNNLEYYRETFRIFGTRFAWKAVELFAAQKD